MNMGLSALSRLSITTQSTEVKPSLNMLPPSVLSGTLANTDSTLLSIINSSWRQACDLNMLR